MLMQLRHLHRVISGGPSRDCLSLGDLTSALGQLEKELGQVVKATIESTLGHLGTVGAMAVDDFVARLKAALCDLSGTAAPLQSVVASDDVPVLPTSASLVASMPVAIPPDVSVSSRQGSVMPSLFGDAQSGVPSSQRTTSAAKPGKNS